MIEVDDSSHQKQKQIERNEKKDAALKAAGVKLLRVPAGNSIPSVLVETFENSRPNTKINIYEPAKTA